MNKLLLLLLFVPFISRAQNDTSRYIPKVGDTAPIFHFRLDKDETQKASLEDYKGKIVVLDFFATWCPPCRAELPRIQKEIWEKYKDNPKFALFAFDRGETWDILLPFKEKSNYTFPMISDKGKKIFKRYCWEYVPQLVVIDENGIIIYKHVGYDEKKFNRLLHLLADRLQ